MTGIDQTVVAPTTFASACRSRRNLRRALITSSIVGPALTLINQTPAVVDLVRGHAIDQTVLIRIGLTFIVPFLVSLFSSALADRARSLPVSGA